MLVLILGRLKLENDQSGKPWLEDHSIEQSSSARRTANDDELLVLWTNDDDQSVSGVLFPTTIIINNIVNDINSNCYNKLSSSLAVRRANDDCSMLWSSNHCPPDRPFTSSSLPSIKTNVPPLQVPFNNIFKSEAWTTLVSCSWTQLGI